MRTIKFRGKAQRDGEWFYGNYTDRDTKGRTHICNLNRGCLDIDPETVGQFTGLHDRKDHEIYDGDIIFVEFDDKSGGNQLVGWNEETASWGIMSTYEYQSLMDGDDWPEFKNHTLLAFLKHAIVCEVVGNIHDNPELIEE